MCVCVCVDKYSCLEEDILLLKFQQFPVYGIVVISKAFGDAPAFIEQYISIGSKPARRVSWTLHRVVCSVHAMYGLSVFFFYAKDLSREAERRRVRCAWVLIDSHSTDPWFKS